MKSHRAFALIEVIIATVVFAICVISVYGAVNYSFVATIVATEKIQAAFLLEGMMDEIKFKRDNGQYSDIIGNDICFDASCAKIDGKFTRKISVQSATRTGTGTAADKFGNIVNGTGTVNEDTNTKKVTMTVEWPVGRQNISDRKISAEMIITNMFECVFP